MKLIAATLIALTLAFAAAPVQAGPGTRDKIRQLIELDGATAVADAVIDKQRPLVRQSFLAGHPGASNKMADAYVEAFAAELTARRGEFLDLIVEIYAGICTAGEVDALLAFYISPLGRKARAAAPSILIQGQQAGAAWGAKYGAAVAAAATARLKALGYAIK
jgi:hypothetical protein